MAGSKPARERGGPRRAPCTGCSVSGKSHPGTRGGVVREGVSLEHVRAGGGVRTLIAVGAECVPELNDRLGRLAAFFGTEHESWAMRQAYAMAPRANFSRAVLQRCPGALAVSKLPALTWCDLGSPARVVRTVTRLGLTPAWLAGALHGLKDTRSEPGTKGPAETEGGKR